MRVLFVSSGNIKELNPIIENQGESIKREGIDITYYTIKGKGFNGYLQNVIPLKKKIGKERYNLIHAHFSLSAITASLTLKKPLIVSLMGSDVHSSGFMLWIIRFLSQFYWDVTIVKSDEMKMRLGLKKVRVIPNGVNTALFKPMDRMNSCRRLGWDPLQKHILFPADKSRPEKNFKLANESCSLLNDPNIRLHTLVNVPNSLMPFYYNAADVVLMTSFWEGSPNVIKEALACDVPVVATDVGDIRINVETLQNCFITGFDPREIGNFLKKAIESGERPDGTGRISQLGLDDIQIAQKLISIYNEVLKNF